MTFLKQNWKQAALLVIIAAFALALRLVAGAYGHNFDMESYWIVGEIANRGDNVYVETTRYNYGPIWLTILSLLYEVSSYATTHFGAFRVLIVFLLSVVDLLISLLLWRKFNGRVALLFLFNPISILITGFHSQFDNLAILLGSIGVLLWEDKHSRVAGGAGLLYLGLSLATKHILFLLPLWLALKKGLSWKRRLGVFIIPPVVFGLGFLPFWTTGSDGIIQNIFLYRSFGNAPFWNAVAPGILVNNIPSFALFVVALALTGLVIRRRSALDSFIIYLGGVVLFASGIANQYLAITSVFVAVYFNFWLATYVLLGAMYILLDKFSGLGLNIPASGLLIKATGLNLQIVLLAVGYTRVIWRDLRNSAPSFSKRELLSKNFTYFLRRP